MITAKAFILRTFPFGESDLVVHALSQTGQKLKLFARGALRSKKRFGGGVLEPTHYVSLLYREGREDGLGQLNEASLVEAFENLRSDYDRLNMALHFVSLVDKLSLEGVTDAVPLFDLLGNALRTLQSASKVSRKLDVLKTQFELKLLYSQGVLPALDNADVLLGPAIRAGEPEGLAPDVFSRLRMQTDLLLVRYLNS